MGELLRIDDEVITADDFVLYLKFTNGLDELLDQMIKDRLLVRAATRMRLTVAAEEVQERADEIRRVLGLHRAAQMLSYLEGMKATVEKFERFVTDLVLKVKMTSQITSDDKVEEYFKLNSPKFDTVKLSHIMVADEGVANEIVAKVEDDPAIFPELAKEYSIADTGPEGGIVGMVRRGSVDPAIEGKIFNAALREPIGPFGPEEGPYEVFMVVGKSPAKLDEYTKDEVRRALLDVWFTEAVKEVSISD